MSNTIYFIQKQALPDYDWEMLRKHVTELFRVSQNLGITLCDNTGEDIITDPQALFIYSDYYQSNCISFNGNGLEGLDYEPFVLTQQIKADSQFCKPKHKPYGWFVAAILLVIHKHFPSYWTIESFGYSYLWHKVRKDLALQLNLKCQKPRECV